jgi:multiple sugar transport system substrate-binding protein
MARLKGLAWGHRRATGPLEPLNARFRRDHPDFEIEWTVRPLSDFEHQPIPDIASRYDLLIIDHPFCGDVAATKAFLPLETVLPDLLGPGADKLYVGPSLASYRYGGHVWAAPIDAATPHAVFRPDLLARVDRAVPKNWDEVLSLGAAVRRRGLWLATPVVTPHAFATVAGLMANLGRPIATDPSVEFGFDREAMGIALDALDSLLAFTAPETLNWNAIAVHEAMIARDDVVFTPGVYGYATYAEADMRAPLRFSDFCGLVAPYHAGSMIGGTGLAVSASSAHPEDAFAFVRFCLSPEAQDRIIPDHHGQPARVSSWEDPVNDARFGGFFSGARSSVESAWVRPRRPRFIRFQAQAGQILEAYCRRDLDRQATLDRIAEAGRELLNTAPRSA